MRNQKCTGASIRSAATISLVLILSIGCNANSARENGSAAPTDPYQGYFANPSVGILELRKKDTSYVGTLTADFGPFPVRCELVGGELQGTVRVAGQVQPVRIRSTDSGLLLTVDNVASVEPLKRYASEAEYRRQFPTMGGYGATGHYTPPPGMDDSAPTTSDSTK